MCKQCVPASIFGGLVTRLCFCNKLGSAVAQLRNDDPSYPLSSPSSLSLPSPPSLLHLSLSSLSFLSSSPPSPPSLSLFPLLSSPPSIPFSPSLPSSLSSFSPPSPLHCVSRELCSAVPRQQTQIGPLCDTGTGTGQPLICCV